MTAAENVPWKVHPPPVNAVRAKEVDKQPNGERTHEIYASTNHVLKKGQNLPKDEKGNFLQAKASNEMESLSNRVGAERPHGNHNGQHAGNAMRNTPYMMGVKANGLLKKHETLRTKQDCETEIRRARILKKHNVSELASAVVNCGYMPIMV